MGKTTAITIERQRSEGSARTPLESPHEPAASLYVHVPFCAHKCHYCDFYSFVDPRDRQDAFTDALIRELRAVAPHAGRPLRTAFVGGGTPSLLRPDRWRRVLDAIDRAFDLSEIRAGRGEFTVECNPESTTPELLATLVAGGVDRVSVGAQSFDPRHLATLERRHDPANVRRALCAARDAGVRRFSIDLIFGIPGQTLEDWRRDLEAALSLDPAPDHLSLYALTYEPGTAMTMRLHRGEFERTDEDLEADMYDVALETLGGAGFERYEVSNFARPGAGGGPSLHNLAYWRSESWLAAGPSASGHVRTEGGGWRWKNVPRLGEWIDGVDASGGWSPVVDLEAPDRARALGERLMMGLRTSEGVDARAVERDARALGRLGEIEAVARRFEGDGLLLAGEGRWRLTERGLLQTDGVVGDLLGAIAPTAG